MPTSASVECGYEWIQSNGENSWYRGALRKG